MAGAFQTAGFAFQGAGQFAFQEAAAAAAELVGRKSRPFEGPQPPPFMERPRRMRGRRIRVVLPDSAAVELGENRAREFASNVVTALSEQTDISPKSLGVLTKALADSIMSPGGVMDLPGYIRGAKISANIAVREIAVAALANTLTERADEDDAEAVLLMLLNS